MRRDFVNEVAKQNKIERVDLVEKDLILHQILTDLSQGEFFSQSFVFKGGTCLTKCYLGYYRFSEDIDFTWKDQAIFEGKSQTKTRRILSETIDRTGAIFEAIAKKRSFDFKCEKHNKHYVELGGSNKICTFKIWYHSEVLNRESFMKVQMNFVEKLYFAPQKGVLSALPSKESDELSFLFPEYSGYMQKISFDVYDMREILCEKVRSILTREGIKARDFLDVYLICTKYGIAIEEMLDPIVGKIRFMLGIYEKYRENFQAKKAILMSEPFRWGEEKGLLLQEIDEKEFVKFLENFKVFLKKVVDKVTLEQLRAKTIMRS
jgi:predicted nucleotidyltransferase component of viral defense system